jgi:hypothetical protein
MLYQNKYNNYEEMLRTVVSSQPDLKHPEEIRESNKNKRLKQLSQEEYLQTVVAGYVASLGMHLGDNNAIHSKDIAERLMQLGVKYNVIPHNESLIVTLVYMKRLVGKMNDQVSDDLYFLKSSSAYHIFAICLLMSLKMLEDNPFNNESFSRLSGIKLKLLNDMEIAFLKVFDFSINVSVDDFDIANDAI